MFGQRFFKYGLLMSFAGGSVTLLAKNKWDISSIGIVRFGRAAIVVAAIAVDYKKSLRRIDPESQEYQEIKSEVHQRSAQRLYNLCCANGGAFIKVGQHIGALEYLLPSEYVTTMKVFHSNAPISRLEDILTVIKEDLGKNVDEIFVDFEPQPLGVASLAQVHKAKLKDGTPVAIKVQHLRVKAHSFIDIKTMELLVHGIAWLFPDFQFLWLSEETKKNLPLELNFVHEGQNCEHVSRLFHKFSFLKVPKIFWDLSSERVLTMEFCEGGKVDDLQYMEDNNISTTEVTKCLGKLYSEMIFVQGYIHCDPHPGNILVYKSPSQGTKIVLLDHGLYTTLTNDFRLKYCHLWLALIKADLNGIKYYAQQLGTESLWSMFACMITARSWKSITQGIDKVPVTENERNEVKTNAANFLQDISNILNRVPREMLLIFKTNDLLRSIEFVLKNQANASSFITMSRCCTRAVYTQNLKDCQSWFCRVQIYFKTFLTLWRINIYEALLRINNSRIYITDKFLTTGAFARSSK